MSISGFTAEASMYESTECYSMAVRFVDSNHPLVGQAASMSLSFPFPGCFVDCINKCMRMPLDNFLHCFEICGWICRDPVF